MPSRSEGYRGRDGQGQGRAIRDQVRVKGLHPGSRAGVKDWGSRVKGQRSWSGPKVRGQRESEGKGNRTPIMVQISRGKGWRSEVKGQAVSGQRTKVEGRRSMAKGQRSGSRVKDQLLKVKAQRSKVKGERSWVKMQRSCIKDQRLG